MQDVMMSWPEFQSLQAVPPEECGAKFMEYLATKHAKRNAVAAWFLIKAGPGVVPMLVQEAVSPGKTPDHRVRLLDIVEKIGVPLDLDSFMNLMVGARSRSQKVRKKIVGVMSALRNAGREEPGV